MSLHKESGQGPLRGAVDEATVMLGENLDRPSHRMTPKPLSHPASPSKLGGGAEKEKGRGLRRGTNRGGHLLDPRALQISARFFFFIFFQDLLRYKSHTIYYNSPI